MSDQGGRTNALVLSQFDVVVYWAHPVTLKVGLAVPNSTTWTSVSGQRLRNEIL